jgi:hypothetical protein
MCRLSVLALEDVVAAVAAGKEMASMLLGDYWEEDINLGGGKIFVAFHFINNKS